MNLVLYTHRGLGLGQIFFWKHGCYNKCTSIILYLIQHHNIYAFKIMKIVSREFSASFRLKGYERSVTINLFSRQMISSSQIKVVNTLHKALASHHEIKTFCDKFVVFLGSIIIALAHNASNSGRNVTYTLSVTHGFIIKWHNTVHFWRRIFMMEEIKGKEASVTIQD